MVVNSQSEDRPAAAKAQESLCATSRVNNGTKLSAESTVVVVLVKGNELWWLRRSFLTIYSRAARTAAVALNMLSSMWSMWGVSGAGAAIWR